MDSVVAEPEFSDGIGTVSLLRLSEQLGLAGLVSPKKRQPGASSRASHRSEMTLVPGTGNPRGLQDDRPRSSELPSRPVPGPGRFSPSSL